MKKPKKLKKIETPEEGFKIVQKCVVGMIAILHKNTKDLESGARYFMICRAVNSVFQHTFKMGFEWGINEEAKALTKMWTEKKSPVSK